MYNTKRKKHVVWKGVFLLGTALLTTPFVLQKEEEIKTAFFQDMTKETSKKVEIWLQMYLEARITEIKQEFCFSPLKKNKGTYSSIHFEKDMKLLYDNSLPPSTSFMQKVMRKK